MPTAPGTLLPQNHHLQLTSFALSVTWTLLHHDGGGAGQRFVSSKADSKLPFFCFSLRNWTDQEEKKAQEFFEDGSKQSKFYKKKKKRYPCLGVWKWVFLGINPISIVS